MTVMASLPDVAVGSTFTHAELIEAFHVGIRGGIRYRGPAEQPAFVLAITSTPGTFVDRPDRRRPYHDRWVEGTIWYTGEGKKGPQELTKGNLALYMQPVHRHPIYLVGQTAPDQYKYLGEYRVGGVTRELQPDEEDSLRYAYVFELFRSKE